MTSKLRYFALGAVAGAALSAAFTQAEIGRQPDVDIIKPQRPPQRSRVPSMVCAEGFYAVSQKSDYMCRRGFNALCDGASWPSDVVLEKKGKPYQHKWHLSYACGPKPHN